jgi:peptidoglycan hydrolase-like protein with peptidoglycan-binding domain
VTRRGWCGRYDFAPMPRLPLLVACACAVALALPIAAPADPVTPAATAPAATTPAPTTPAGPALGKLGLALSGAYRLGSQTVTVTGRAVRANGVVRPFVAGQSVIVHVFRGHALVHAETVPVVRSAGGTYGHFSVRFVPDSPGDYAVTAIHDGTPDQKRFTAATPLLHVVRPIAGPGSTGTFVSLIQSRLLALGYATPRSGRYDYLTGLAVLAYRKVNGMPRITTLSGSVVSGLLRGVGGFHVRFPNHGHHVEGNLGQQVLAEIDHGKVYRVYVISSGKPSTPTVLGTFRVYRKQLGTNAHGMVDSSYFIGGYAIHGYVSVPTYAASHGCMRVPIPDARAIYDWVRFGDIVDVYY